MTQKATYLVVEGIGSNTSASGGIAWTYGMPTNHGTVSGTYEWHGGFSTGAGLIEVPDIGGAEVDPYSARYAGGSARVQIVWDDLARSMWSNRPNVATAYLGANVSKTETTLDIDGTADGVAWSSAQEGSVVWCGEEAIKLGTYSAGTYTGCTRGYFSTAALAHSVDEMVFTSNPMRATRSAWIYELDIVTGTSTQKWQGFVRPRSPYSVSGKVLTVELVDDIAATSQARVNRDYRIVADAHSASLGNYRGGKVLRGVISMGTFAQYGADIRVQKALSSRPHYMAFQVGDKGAVWAQRADEVFPRAKLPTNGSPAIRGGDITERFEDERAYEVLAIDRERDIQLGLPGFYQSTLYSSTREAQYPFHPLVLSMALLTSTSETTPGEQGSGAPGVAVYIESPAASIEVVATIAETYTPPAPAYPTDAIIFFDETTARWQDFAGTSAVTTHGQNIWRIDNDGSIGGYWSYFGTAPTHDATSDAEVSVAFGGSGAYTLWKSDGSGSLDDDALTILTGQGFEAFVVITDTTDTATNRGVLGKWNVGGSAGEWILMHRDFNSPNAVLFGPKNYYNRGASGDQVNDGNPHILGGRVNTSDVAFVSIDGYDVNSGTTVTTLPSNGTATTHLGSYDTSGATYFTGRIGEIHVFDYELSASERTAMIDYLNAKWGVDVGGIPSFIDYAWEVDELTGYSDGDTLTGWPNAKGGVDMTVTSAPKWYAGGGSPYVQLSGGYLNAAIGSKSQPNTVIMVWNNSSTGSVRVFTDSPSGARNSLWFETDGTLKWAAYAGEAAPYSKTASPAISTGLQMSACVFNGSSTIIRVNGTTSSAMTSTGTAAMNGFRFGANVSGLYPPLAADKFYAVYVVDGALTTAQLDAMQTYCQSKWGTP